MKSPNFAVIAFIVIFYSSAIIVFDDCVLASDLVRAEQERLLKLCKQNKNHKEQHGVAAAITSNEQGHITLGVFTDNLQMPTSSSPSRTNHKPVARAELHAELYNLDPVDDPVAQVAEYEAKQAATRNNTSSSSSSSSNAASAAVQALAQREPHRAITIFAAPRPGENQPQELLTDAFPLSTTVSSLRAALAKELQQHFPNRVVRFCGVSKNSNFQRLNAIHSEAEPAVTVGDLPTIPSREAVYDYSENKWGALAFIPSQAVELMVEIDAAKDFDHQFHMISESLAYARIVKAEAAMKAKEHAAAPLTSFNISALAPKPQSAPASANFLYSSSTDAQRKSKIVKPIARRPTAALAHTDQQASPDSPPLSAPCSSPSLENQGPN